jgi:hypothetical protein
VEYRSNLSVLGLPLIHVATGAIASGIYRRRVAMGWIAVGDVALGIFFSCGGVALGGISVGGASLGVLSLGGLAFGAAAVGGLAVGVLALGGAAFAWYTAIGGVAVAHDYAVGGVAFAQHVVSPLSPDLRAKYPLPRPPFRASDTLWLIGIVVALLVVARLVQVQRKRWR